MGVLLANLPTILTALLVFGVFFLIIFKQIQARRQGKRGCGGCGGCPSASICHDKK